LVIDTTLFAKRGWAAKALALGWTEQELFALSPSGDWLGLTARLYGSPIIALDADAVTIREPHGHYRLRRTEPTKDAIMLWDLGL
jgi:hypothetical protein